MKKQIALFLISVLSLSSFAMSETCREKYSERRMKLIGKTPQDRVGHSIVFKSAVSGAVAGAVISGPVGMGVFFTGVTASMIMENRKDREVAKLGNVLGLIDNSTNRVNGTSLNDHDWLLEGITERVSKELGREFSKDDIAQEVVHANESGLLCSGKKLMMLEKIQDHLVETLK